MSEKTIQCPDQIDFLADAYFADCIENKKPLTFSGLAYALGFADTSSLYRYRKAEGYEEFHEPMNRVCLRIEQFIEEQLYNKGVNVAGPIFALKARIGLTDKDPNDKGQQVTIKIDGIAAKL